MRISRLIENMTLGTAAVGYLPESMHGAGSLQAQRIMISRLANIEEKSSQKTVRHRGRMKQVASFGVRTKGHKA